MLLLLMTEGRPVLNLTEVASILSLEPRSVQNKIYTRQMPFLMFKLGNSANWVAHVSDVAAYIDTQREEASKTWSVAGAWFSPR